MAGFTYSAFQLLIEKEKSDINYSTHPWLREAAPSEAEANSPVFMLLSQGGLVLGAGRRAAGWLAGCWTAGPLAQSRAGRLSPVDGNWGVK